MPGGNGMTSRDLLIVGDGGFAEIAHEYFIHDSDYRVVGFAVERPFLHRESLFGLPVVALDEAPRRFPPASHSFYAALVYTDNQFGADQFPFFGPRDLCVPSTIVLP